jgi:thymidylate synthase (FAD)
MKKKLIKVKLIDTFGSDLTVVNCARVSFNRISEELNERDEKLIKYLLKHEHTSPFRHCFLQWRIEAPIFILRQWQKHQVGCSWNEMSRRYVDTPPEVYCFDQWHSRPHKSIKQGAGSALNEDEQVICSRLYERAVSKSLEVYDDLLAMGVAPEQARAVLPQGMITSCVWSASLQSALHFVKLRLSHDAQSEIREYAQLIAEDIKTHYPITFEAFMESDK